MKKSTVLLLVVVYIISFFIIGLLGNSVRSYDPVYEPESIELVEPDGKTFLSNDDGQPITVDDKDYHYWFVYQGYVTGSVVRIKANVKPDNSTYPNVSFVKDSQDTSFVMETHETNPDIEENFALFYLTEDIPYFAVTASFTVISQNPGIQIKVNACIVFAI